MFPPLFLIGAGPGEMDRGKSEDLSRGKGGSKKRPCRPDESDKGRLDPPGDRTCLVDRRDGLVATLGKVLKRLLPPGLGEVTACVRAGGRESHRPRRQPHDDRARVGHRLNDPIVEMRNYPDNAKKPRRQSWLIEGSW